MEAQVCRKLLVLSPVFSSGADMYVLSCIFHCEVPWNFIFDYFTCRIRLLQLDVIYANWEVMVSVRISSSSPFHWCLLQFLHSQLFSLASGWALEAASLSLFFFRQLRCKAAASRHLQKWFQVIGLGVRVCQSQRCMLKTLWRASLSETHRRVDLEHVASVIQHVHKKINQ